MYRYLILVLAVTPAYGAKSLMLAAAEQAIIAQVLKPEEPNCLRLNAILYNTTDDWVIWINGQRFDNNDHGAYTITDVTAKWVEIMVDVNAVKLHINKAVKFGN